jgi:DNA relaxase NicK
MVDPDTERRLALVMWDGKRKPHVFAEGTESYDSPVLWNALRERCAGLWTPSRIDPALDFEDPDWFDVLSAALIDIAQRRRMELNHKGDWTRGKARTLYVGSRESGFYIRLYEYRDHHGYGPAVRLEVEIKLKPEHRAKLAAAMPDELLGLSPVVHELLTRIGMDVSRFPVTNGSKPPPSIDRDLAYLARQALPALLRVAAALGSEAAVMDALKHYARDSEAVRDALRTRDYCIKEQLHSV